VHNPIEKDKFIFHKTGELVEYTFNPNLFKDYNVSIVSSKPFPTKEKFNWKIKYELIKDGKINKDGYLKELTRIYEGKDQKKAKIINFKSFGILRKWPGEVTLKMFVEKGDLAAAKYANQFKLNIGISWYK
jgi:hypothetical protein